MKIARQELLGHVFDVVSQLNPVGPLAESTPIEVVIALPAQNVEERTALLRDIYDPASPRFRQFLSPLEYTQRFDPTEASYQSLLDFAKANQLTVVSTAPPKFIHVTAPAAVINQVFHVTLQQYQHPTEDRHFYAPDADPAVTLETPDLQITGLDNFRIPRRAPNLFKSRGKVSGSSRQASGSGNNGLYTGGDFRAAYAPGVTLTGKGQVVGILELDGYVESDISMYEQQNGIPNVPLQNVYLDGYTGGNPIDESAADIELVISMAPGLAQVTIYGVGYSNPGIIDVLHEMANPTQGEQLPSQITTSYYFFYDKNVYDALARLAAQGQALFVASGDGGSYNEQTGTGDFPPADHPLVTSVGGTELVTSGPGGAWTSETTASFSGGGYSPWESDPQFAIPRWQAGMDYTASKGSTTVRNAPDVSIVADSITVFSNGSWRGFAGTSAAAPLWAGFMALANEQAAVSGRPRVGFANPALWAIGRGGNGPTCFHDITTGNNFNSTNPNLYSAVAGYDLCTGWGTPNGQDLIDALIALDRLTLYGLPAMAASGNRTVTVATTPDGMLVWKSWELGSTGPWTSVPISGPARFTNVAPAVSFRTTEGGTAVWLAIKDSGDNQIYETLQQPDGSFGAWTLIPGVSTHVSPAVSDGNLAMGSPIMAVVAAPPDDTTYINVYLADQPPASPPPGYWNAVNPSLFTALAPALTIVDQGNYMFLAVTAVNLEGPNSRLMLNQGNPYTPDQFVGWNSMSFDSNLAPAMAAANNRTVIVAVDPNGAIFYDWWDLGGGPHGWVPLGNDVQTTVAPAVALVDNGNYLFVYAQGLDGRLYLNQGNVGGAIVGWQLT